MPHTSRRNVYVVSPLLDRLQRINPVPVQPILMAGQADCFLLFFTVQLLRQATVIGLDPFEMVLVGTMLEVTCFLFAVPTGVVADVYSQSRSILIGVTPIGCASEEGGAVPTFWAALGDQLSWTTGYTCTSGATQAWITDDVGKNPIGSVFLRGEQVQLAGGLVRPQRPRRHPTRASGIRALHPEVVRSARLGRADPAARQA